MVDVWILGGTGRAGRGVAADLAGGGGIEPVLVGRDAGRLRGGRGRARAADVRRRRRRGVAAGVREAARPSW